MHTLREVIAYIEEQELRITKLEAKLANLKPLDCKIKGSSKLLEEKPKDRPNYFGWDNGRWDI